MAKVMWLGEDIGDVPGPSFTTCYGLKFKKDVNVEINDEAILQKARGNLMFKVSEDKPSTLAKPKQEVMLKQEAEQYDTSGARDVTPKQETQHAQGKALERKAQELKSKIETKKEDYDYRKAEKGSGYSPAKKTKEKAASRRVSHTRSSSTDTDAA